MKYSLLILLALLFTGCSSGSCPIYAVKRWTISEQEQIAAERNALPQDSILRPVLDEWERDRRESR